MVCSFVKNTLENLQKVHALVYKKYMIWSCVSTSRIYAVAQICKDACWFTAA